jgi:hypothetical protein
MDLKIVAKIITDRFSKKKKKNMEWRKGFIRPE